MMTKALERGYKPMSVFSTSLLLNPLFPSSRKRSMDSACLSSASPVLKVKSPVHMFCFSSFLSNAGHALVHDLHIRLIGWNGKVRKEGKSVRVGSWEILIWQEVIATHEYGRYELLSRIWYGFTM